MKFKSMYLTPICMLLIGLVTPVRSQEAEAPSELRVARLSYLEGQATLQRDGDEEWMEATLNSPLFESYKIYTSPGARAEVQLEDNVVIRMAGDSFIHLEQMNPAVTRIGIIQGSVAIHARPVSYGRPWVEIHTPYATARIVDYANVRMEVPEQGQAEFRVRRGTLEVDSGPNRVRLVRAGQRLYISSPDVLMTGESFREDDFDLWCDLRDARDAASSSPEYVTHHVPGYSDLDRHGDWVVVAEHGRVWRPRITVVDWAPYREGRWVYRLDCGWTWVSYEPWGWVPYHYGRWARFDRYGWCWVPGDIVVVRRPVWSPALVAFTYSNHNTFLSVSIGSHWNSPWIGWFPLGPGDPWCGWYVDRHHRHYDYFRRHHDRYRDDRHHYRNADVAKAVTIIPREDFGLNDYARIQRASLKRSAAPASALGAPAAQTLSEDVFEKAIAKNVQVARTTITPPKVRADDRGRLIPVTQRESAPKAVTEPREPAVSRVPQSPAKLTEPRSPNAPVSSPVTREVRSTAPAKAIEARPAPSVESAPSRRPSTSEKSSEIRIPTTSSYVISGRTGQVESPVVESEPEPSRRPSTSYKFSAPVRVDSSESRSNPVIRSEPVKTYSVPSTVREETTRSSSYSSPSESNSGSEWMNRNFSVSPSRSSTSASKSRSTSVQRSYSAPVTRPEPVRAPEPVRVESRAPSAPPSRSPSSISPPASRTEISVPEAPASRSGASNSRGGRGK